MLPELQDIPIIIIMPRSGPSKNSVGTGRLQSRVR